MDMCKEAFIKAGFWPNTVMFDMWKQAWTLAEKAQKDKSVEICRWYERQSSSPMNFARNCADAIEKD